MNETPFLSAIFLTALHVLIQFALVARAVAPVGISLAHCLGSGDCLLPVLGILSYLLFGEVNIGRRRVQRMRAVLARMPALPDAADTDVKLRSSVPERHVHLFRVGHSISRFEPVGGNSACLLADSNAVIDAMVAGHRCRASMSSALLYLAAGQQWPQDRRALKRATARGVACRAMADDLGSRLMIQSEHWRAIGAAGIRLARALPIGNPLRRALTGRIDLRNHRKIVVIDGRITYCGSRNCADPGFGSNRKYAPWVDAMMRFEADRPSEPGSVRQRLDGPWTMTSRTCCGNRSPFPPGLPAQVIGTGPTVRYSAMRGCSSP